MIRLPLKSPPKSSPLGRTWGVAHRYGEISAPLLGEGLLRINQQ